MAGLILVLMSSIGVAGPVKIGSKTFAESSLIAEVAAQRLENSGMQVTRKFSIGGTGLIFEALQHGDIDIYPEYTGTISEAILKNPHLRDWSSIHSELEKMGLVISRSLGFEDSYALAVRREFAQANGLRSISDLMALGSKPKAAFSHEFMTRPDGFRGLTDSYRGSWGSVQAVEHNLAFEAIGAGNVDVIDAYTTDPQIEKMNLVLLEDDRHYFPHYEAVWLAKKTIESEHGPEWDLLQKMEGQLKESDVRFMNEKVVLDHKSIRAVARAFLRYKQLSEPSLWREMLLRTKEHFLLVGISLLLAAVCGVPLGIVAAFHARLGQLVLVLASALQTIPSLALLCFLIPVLGIGTKAALVALFLYGLLPIIVNTFVGLRNIDESLIEMARALGLTAFQRLRLIEIPLATPSILSGVRTSAVIGIGTATLAALIGAGGYGVPIVSGLANNDIPTVLTGAVPAAVMAIFVNLFFSQLTRALSPRGLRK